MTNTRYIALIISHARSLLLLVWIQLMILFVGCSSVSTTVNKGAVRANTFSFMDRANRQTPDYAERSQQAHALVQQAIANNLASKGITRANSGGDVTVAYLIIVGNNVATTSLNEYFGYSDDSTALVEKVHDTQAGSKKEDRNYYESGTLVIDFLDPKSSQLIQRRSIQAPVLRNLTMEQRSARVQTVVDQALANLPVTH
jgi:hypothetical protein